MSSCYRCPSPTSLQANLSNTLLTCCTEPKGDCMRSLPILLLLLAAASRAAGAGPGSKLFVRCKTNACTLACLCS